MVHQYPYGVTFGRDKWTTNGAGFPVRVKEVRGVVWKTEGGGGPNPKLNEKTPKLGKNAISELSMIEPHGSRYLDDVCSRTIDVTRPARTRANYSESSDASSFGMDLGGRGIHRKGRGTFTNLDTPTLYSELIEPPEAPRKVEPAARTRTNNSGAAKTAIFARALGIEVGREPANGCGRRGRRDNNNNNTNYHNNNHGDNKENEAPAAWGEELQPQQQPAKRQPPPMMGVRRMMQHMKLVKAPATGWDKGATADKMGDSMMAAKQLGEESSTTGGGGGAMRKMQKKPQFFQQEEVTFDQAIAAMEMEKKSMGEQKKKAMVVKQPAMGGAEEAVVTFDQAIAAMEMEKKSMGEQKHLVARKAKKQEIARWAVDETAKAVDAIGGQQDKLAGLEEEERKENEARQQRAKAVGFRTGNWGAKMMDRIRNK